jgi:hypothetical protein
MTLDRKTVIKNQIVKINKYRATYCYSNDGINCYSDYLS